MCLKTFRFVLPAVCCFVLTVAGIGSAKDDKAKPDYVAKVNGTIITQAEFDRELNMTMKQYEAMGQQVFDAHLEAIRKQVVEVMIDRELLYQESQKKKIVVKDSVVDEQFEMWKKHYAPDGNYATVLADTGYTEKI